jgi:hypothetical protein
MIVTRLKGGLGNQLFQWAFARNISHLNNEELFLDISFLKKTPTGNTKRDFILDKFPNITGYFTESVLFTKQIRSLGDETKYLSFNYNKYFDYYLDGYFQSEDYFKDSQDIVRKELRPSLYLYNKLSCIPKINTNTTSLHIRRTDYLTSNGYHPIQPIEYYENALDIIGEYDNLFIFSDDIEWCKNNLKFDKMIFVEGGNEVEDLHLMSLCKNNIIANSSFSWWGAWLNQNNDKKVILPNKWFGPNVEYNSSDTPIGWIRL